MGKLIDLTGKRFGFWIVKGIGPKNKNGKTQWICQCECGTEKLVDSNSLRSCNSTSCRCNHNPNLINARFGKLIVVEQVIYKNNSRKHWLCKCDCGNVIILTTHQLKNLNVNSCKDCDENSNNYIFNIISKIEMLLDDLRIISKTTNAI